MKKHFIFIFLSIFVLSHAQEKGSNYTILNEKSLEYLPCPSFWHGHSFVDNYALIQQKKFGKWGIVDTNGTLATGFVFDKISTFAEGMVFIYSGCKAGFVGGDGKWKVGPLPLKTGYASTPEEFITNERVSVMEKFPNDTVLDFVKETNYGFRTPFLSEGLVSFYDPRTHLAGYLKIENGTAYWAIKPRFNYARDFNEGLAKIGISGIDAIIDKDGNIVFEIPPGYERYNVSEGMIKFMECATGKHGFFLKENPFYDNEKKLNWAIKPSFEKAGNFKCGRCIVIINNKYCAIDKKGNIIFDKISYEGNDFNIDACNDYQKDGHTHADIINSLTGKKETVIIDTLGQVIFSNAKLQKNTGEKWEVISYLGEGIIEIYDTKKKYGIVDINRKIIVPPAFNRIYRYSCGIAQVKDKKDQMRYLNLSIQKKL